MAIRTKDGVRWETQVAPGVLDGRLLYPELKVANKNDICRCWSAPWMIFASSRASWTKDVVNEVKVYQIHRSKSVPPCDEISALFCHRVNKPLLSF
jgi:hypothetical protein